ncbi:hypothetical protein [Aliidiomarina celeris]|uniref:hypothetical protein n=1 Tax=Aliidiomarina celeris TaxID=2249428 RepID=UPI000DE9060C|nr:hypothetical protein [Aliidiomarina celeris]
MKFLTPVVLSTVLLAATFGSARADTLHNLMLIGSELEICSSMESQHCVNNEWIVANDMRTARLFQLTDVRRREATSQAIWPRERNDMRNRVASALEELAEYFGRGVVPDYRFIERLRSRAYLDLLMELSEAEYERILDRLELARVPGLNDVANVSESPAHTQELMQAFKTMLEPLAGDNTPNVVLITAAARDSFSAVERYTSAFEQIGVKVTWLPVSAVVTRAQQSNQCENLESLRRTMLGTFDRDRVNAAFHEQQVAYCKSNAWQDTLANAQGVFFVDGRADRLRDAFVVEQEPTPLLRGILQRYFDGSLVMAAEGGAAQGLVANNMVTNGTSRDAMLNGANARPAPPLDCDLEGNCPRGLNANSLTYDTLGGLKVYNYGVVDTDVSQRGLQIRMMRIAQATGTPLALGIDRHTALLVNTAQGFFRVVGENGVFGLENAQGTDRMLAGSFHYLMRGATGRISSTGLSEVELVEQSNQRIEEVTNRFLGNSGIKDSLDSLCRRGNARLLQENIELVMQTTDDSTVLPATRRCQVLNATIGVQRTGR